MRKLSDLKITVIGLGYLGFPLAVEFGKKVPVVGFDIHQKRIDALKNGKDHTLEVSPEELKQAHQLAYMANLEDLTDCNVFIVTVPTSIDEYKQPDLMPLVKASQSIGQVLKKGNIVVYESTVYPGATEEICIPVLEKVSGLKFNEDFFAGYSPECINLGDKLLRVTNILKITSGSTNKAQSLDFHPEIFLTEHRLNNGIKVIGSKRLVMHLSFKKNCPDIRNTKNVDVANLLKKYDLDIDIYDPWIDPQDVVKEYSLMPISKLEFQQYDAIILAVAHDQFKKISDQDLNELAKQQYVFFDLKYVFSKDKSSIRL